MLPPKSPGAVEGEGTASSPEMEAEFLAALLSGDVLDRPMLHRALSSLPEAGVDGDAGVPAAVPAVGVELAFLGSRRC